MQIDALLTDLGLPDGSGLELIADAANHLPGCDSLVISMFGDEDNVLASIEAGATGYLHKDSAPADIAHSILQLKAGESPMSPMIARRLLGKYRSMSAAQAPQAPDLQLHHADPFLKQNRPIAGIESAQNAPEIVALAEGIRRLSKREAQVLEYISRGFSYAEVAHLSHVSVHTVQTHI
ncbi:MAG: response regulator, partial [Brachymonas sp.]